MDDKHCVELFYIRQRKIKDKKTGEEKWKGFANSANITAPSHAELFDDLESYIERIPEAERYNVYYTTNYTNGQGKRKFVKNDTVWFDVDNIDQSRIAEYVDAFFSFFQVDPNKTVVVNSGNGLQFLVQRLDSRHDLKLFPTTRNQYARQCENFLAFLKIHGLVVTVRYGEGETATSKPTEVDVLWDAGRLFRLPMTENRKPHRATKRASLINRILLPQDMMTGTLEETTTEGDSDFVEWEGDADHDFILGEEGCPAIKHFCDVKGNVSEPAWYKVLSVVGRFEDGIEFAKKHSTGHPLFDPLETEKKTLQAISRSGPRTCKSFSEDFDQCEKCPYKGIVHSPIQLVPNDKITTAKDGFHYQAKNNQWYPKYSDLVVQFCKDHDFIVDADSETLYIYNGKHWSPLARAEIKNWASKKMTVQQLHRGSDHIQAASAKVNEFYNRLMNCNVVDSEELIQRSQGKICFANGVYCFKDGFIGHSEKTKQMYFMNSLDFDYDDKAKAPRFEQFLDEVTLDRTDLKENLLRFGGYSISNADYIFHKCLLMVGGGANGKSTFMQTLQGIINEDSCSALSMRDLSNEQQRANLRGKLVNISEETPTNSLGDSSIFKNLTGGGVVTAKEVYKPAFKFKNRAKLIFACNELPKSKDWTYGFQRRLIIIPFDATFSGSERDNRLEYKLLKERAGIVNMFIGSYKKLIEENGFMDSNVIKEQLEEYATDNESSFDAYLKRTGFRVLKYFSADDDAELVKGPVYVESMYADYRAYCQFAGENFSFTLRGFGMKLRKHIETVYGKPALQKIKDRKRTDGSSLAKSCYEWSLWHPFGSNRQDGL